MEPRLEIVHIEIETGRILLRMAGIVHERELFGCADRIRKMAGKAHQRAAQHLEQLPDEVLADSDREALLAKIEHLKSSVDQRAPAGPA